MKRSCKHIDIKDPKQIQPWVLDCLKRHYTRYDFKQLLLTIGGLAKEEYRQISPQDKSSLEKASYPIAEECARRIAGRNLRLAPVRIAKRVDKSTGKERLIGKESAMQQVFDHIAVGSCRAIFDRRIVPQQASSIKGRGQCYGVGMISRWIKKDCRAAAWAKRHRQVYYRKTKYYVKMDVGKCYPSCRVERFMKLFRRDCANEDILWLWETLLDSHHVVVDGTDELYEGFMIGALPSQWACQYMLSFAYRRAMGRHKTRRGKKRKLVVHMLIFMDDFYLCSSSRKDLKMAAGELTRYVRDGLGLSLKPDWQILDVDESPVDMMGFRIHADGNVTIRPRVFLRARRTALRAVRNKGMCVRQAARMLAYKGFFGQNRRKADGAVRMHKAGMKTSHIVLPLRCSRVRRKLHLKWAFKTAAHIMKARSRKERERHAGSLLRGTSGNQLHAAAGRQGGRVAEERYHAGRG